MAEEAKQSGEGAGTSQVPCGATYRYVDFLYRCTLESGHDGVHKDEAHDGWYWAPTLTGHGHRKGLR